MSLLWLKSVVSCCAALNHFRRDESHKEKSLCSDYHENVGQNRMRGIRSYNKVCKFLDSSKTHALRGQHELKKYNCSGQRTNTQLCSCRMPIFDKNFPGPCHGCTRHEYSRILLLWRQDHVFEDKRIHAQIAHTLNS